MADNPPFMNATGNLSKILDKIKEAQTPTRFTYDYLGSTLGFKGGSSRPFIPLAKRLGLLGSDSTPTELYRRFRNPSESKAAMAEAMRKGYADLFRVNEHAHTLNKSDLTGLVAQVTGLSERAAVLLAGAPRRVEGGAGHDVWRRLDIEALAERGRSFWHPLVP